MSTTTDTTTVSAGTCLACGFVNATTDAAVTAMTCGGCHARVSLSWVTGRFNGRIPCDDRCQYATGPICSCSCGGTNHRVGYINVAMVPVWVRERDAQRHADKLARAAGKAAAARQAAADGMAALLADHPVLAGLSDERYDGDYGFMGDMRKALESGSMSPRQIDAACNAVLRDQAREAKRAAIAAEKAALIDAGVTVPTGRMQITGEIVSIREQDNNFSYHGGVTHKLIIKTDDGWTVMGTMPKSLAPSSYTGGDESTPTSYAAQVQALKGRRVTLTATVEQGRQDPTFGFYSRPTRAALAD